MLEHRPGAAHPERPERLEAILADLDARPIAGTRRESASPAAREAIERVHRLGHVQAMEAIRGRGAFLDQDTVASEGSIPAAYLAAGAAIRAAEHTLDGGGPAFALGRPPGHHAERRHAMGFCLFNNVAIAAAQALERSDVERVLIVDWDVHHGNGTQHIFEDRDDVLFFSAHQGDFYPGTGLVEERGRGRGEGFTVNAPLRSGAGDDELRAAFLGRLIPAAQSFGPDLVLVSAGFDAHVDDPLAGLRATSQGFATLTRMVRDLAVEECDGRLALVLEGGYDTIALAKSVRACIEELVC
ncbi:MAG: histone deacetylase [Proteobacteria bacterium]|nr:histone deacetylase [Pseudomonadota bacterium]MCP4915509.1 histone deacetylase [Pseudomonadota bacterium]